METERARLYREAVTFLDKAFHTLEKRVEPPELLHPFIPVPVYAPPVVYREVPVYHAPRVYYKHPHGQAHGYWRKHDRDHDRWDRNDRWERNRSDYRERGKVAQRFLLKGCDCAPDGQLLNSVRESIPPVAEIARVGGVAIPASPVPDRRGAPRKTPRNTGKTSGGSESFEEISRDKD